MEKKARLGRGLDALIGNGDDHGNTQTLTQTEAPLDAIERNPYQPRKEFDPEGLERLARSLKERGQLQPLRVRWDAEMGKWVIVVGERRWRAAVQAGLSLVSAVEVAGPLTEDEILGMCFLLLLAGLDTVTDALECDFAYLATHPAARQAIVDDPEIIPLAVEELLRWETPVTSVPCLKARTGPR